MLVVLTGLQLNNIALIDSLELDFCGGFTVLTGETGAGKSILLDALDAVLGGAQGANGLRLLRSGCDRAQIEASFNPSDQVRQWLLEADIDCDDDELLLSREWKRQDETRFSSRSRLNGISVKRRMLVNPTVRPPTPKPKPKRRKHFAVEGRLTKCSQGPHRRILLSTTVEHTAASMRRKTSLIHSSVGSPSPSGMHGQPSDSSDTTSAMSSIAAIARSSSSRSLRLLIE